MTAKAHYVGVYSHLAHTGKYAKHLHVVELK